MKVRITKIPTHLKNGGDIYAQPYLGTTDLTYNHGGAINNNYLQMNGDKHSAPSEGIDYTPGVKVEDGEAIWKKDDGSKYVFSDQLGFAKQFDKMKNKYSLRSNDKLSTDILNQKLGKLEQEQEILKATNTVKDKYKQMAKGGYIKAEDGLTIPRTEGYYNFDTSPQTDVGIPMTQTTMGTMDVQDPTLKLPNNPNPQGKQDYSKYLPYLGAASQAIGDLAYYGKGYNKLKTVNYQAPQYQSYNPALLNPNQALSEADLATRTQLSQVPNYSNGNSATALNNMLAAGNIGARNKADIRSNYDNTNTQIKNAALAANNQGINNFALHNAGMKYQSDLGNLQDLTQMQNADIGHLSNLGKYGAQGVKDQMQYNQQGKDAEMINNLYKNYYIKGNTVYSRATNKPLKEE